MRLLLGCPDASPRAEATSAATVRYHQDACVATAIVEIQMTASFTPVMLSLALSLCSCAGAPGWSADFAFGEVRAYAWKEPLRWTGARDEDQETVLSDFQRRVGRNMKRLEISDGPAEQAQILLRGELGIETRTHQMDPVYSIYSEEQFEVASMTLEIYDQRGRDLIWTDREELRICTTGHRFRRTRDEEWRKTNHPRHWQIYAMVDALIARIPR